MRFISIIKRMEQINRLKVVLVEQKRTGKWLAELLNVDIKELLVSSKEK